MVLKILGVNKNDDQLTCVYNIRNYFEHDSLRVQVSFVMSFLIHDFARKTQLISIDLLPLLHTRASIES